jgi:hypothetical protein
MFHNLKGNLSSQASCKEILILSKNSLAHPPEAGGLCFIVFIFYTNSNPVATFALSSTASQIQPSRWDLRIDVPCLTLAEPLPGEK